MQMILTDISGSSLEHYGIPKRSGRYPYGSGERPYQSSGGVPTKTKKKAQRSYDREKKKLDKILKKETEKKKREEEEAKRKEESEKARKEAERKAILRDPAKLKKHQYEFSPEEVRNAVQRFDWDEKLHQQSRQKLERGANILDSLYKYMNVGLKYYNFAAGAHNVFKPDDKPWEKINIGTGGGDKKKSQKSSNDSK